jgi:hypothetical protein
MMKVSRALAKFKLTVVVLLYIHVTQRALKNTRSVAIAPNGVISVEMSSEV